jgi:hypothetical protein
MKIGILCNAQGLAPKRTKTQSICQVFVKSSKRSRGNQTAKLSSRSGILFVGLGLNALFGWSWADSIAAMLMVPIIAREGIEA